jgi:hypothetical protein
LKGNTSIASGGLLSCPGDKKVTKETPGPRLPPHLTRLSRGLILRLKAAGNQAADGQVPHLSNRTGLL